MVDPTSDYRGPWIQTAHGRRLDLIDPPPEQIHIDDIAAALSKLCRFNGACRPFYSVAQHSIHVSRLVPPNLALWGLLHDAAEFAVGDMLGPLKRLLPQYAAIELGFTKAIATRFGLSMPRPLAVKHADRVALATEQRDLMKPPPAPWPDMPAPDAEVIRVMPGNWVEAAFLRRFNEIIGA